jgi:outer membrane protein assembly factor BamB
LKNGIHIILSVVSAIFVAALVWWNFSGPKLDLNVSLPGMDNRSENESGEAEVVNVGAFFKRFINKEVKLSDTWPRFRGADFDNIKKSGVGLVDTFGPEDPRIQWKEELGEGHAGAAIYKGRVYVLDYDEKLKADMLRCFLLTEGTEVWRRWYEVNIKRNHGMSRTIPAVTEDFILTIGPRSHVMCLDRFSGDLLWGKDIEKEYETEIPFWYTGQCPLIDEGKAIIATGGKALIIAVDCKTGEVLWETPNPDGIKMSHASVMPWIFKGTKMYVYSGVGGVAGIAADGPEEGKILWKSLKWGCSVVAPSPLCLPDGKIFLTAGYGAGSMVFQITVENGTFQVEKLYDYKPNEGLACEQQTPVYFNGMVYGILPKDAGPYRNQLICTDPSDFRKFIWTSGKTHRFGLGPYMIADGKFYILNDDGMLSIVRPSRDQFILLDQKKIFDAQDAWAPLAIADGFLLLRDAHQMICLDIRKNG